MKNKIEATATSVAVDIIQVARFIDTIIRQLSSSINIENVEAVEKFINKALLIKKELRLDTFREKALYFKDIHAIQALYQAIWEDIAKKSHLFYILGEKSGEQDNFYKLRKICYDFAIELSNSFPSDHPKGRKLQLHFLLRRDLLVYGGSVLSFMNFIYFVKHHAIEMGLNESNSALIKKLNDLYNKFENNRRFLEPNEEWGLLPTSDSHLTPLNEQDLIDVIEIFELIQREITSEIFIDPKEYDNYLEESLVKFHNMLDQIDLFDLASRIKKNNFAYAKSTIWIIAGDIAEQLCNHFTAKLKRIEPSKLEEFYKKEGKIEQLYDLLKDIVSKHTSTEPLLMEFNNRLEQFFLKNLKENVKNHQNTPFKELKLHKLHKNELFKRCFYFIDDLRLAKYPIDLTALIGCIDKTEFLKQRLCLQLNNYLALELSKKSSLFFGFFYSKDKERRAIIKLIDHIKNSSNSLEVSELNNEDISALRNGDVFGIISQEQFLQFIPCPIRESLEEEINFLENMYF